MQELLPPPPHLPPSDVSDLRIKAAYKQGAYLLLAINALLSAIRIYILAKTMWYHRNRLLLGNFEQ